MTPFRPIGARARWRTVYDMLRGVKTGDVVTYEALGKALDLDPEADRHTIQMAVRRAAREHEVEDKRAIDVVPNQGYMVVPPRENLRLARGQHKRAGKALARGQSKVINVDLSGVDPETRQAFEVFGRIITTQLEFNRRVFARQAKLEDSVSAMTQRTDRTEQEVADLKARLARLEGLQDGPAS